jgi:transposase
MSKGMQLVIGADSRNSFTVFKDSEKNLVKVYYGMAFFESAPLDKGSFEYKYLLAKLYNSGIKVKELIHHFGFSYPTYKRWGDALKSGDEERIYVTFSGQGGKHRKLTADIIAFIIHDFGHVYKRNKYSYSQEIRQDIKEVFGKELSSELIRPLLNELKGAFQKKGKLSEEEKKRIYKSQLR